MPSSISDLELNIARYQLDVKEKTWIIQRVYRLECPLVSKSIG